LMVLLVVVPPPVTQNMGDIKFIKYKLKKIPTF
jgi:hypothetical protein